MTASQTPRRSLEFLTPNTMSKRMGSAVSDPVESVNRMDLGMISHKKSLITIFGHKHFRQKFHQKFVIFHVKFVYEIANLESKLL